LKCCLHAQQRSCLGVHGDCCHLGGLHYPCGFFRAHGSLG
jgi:hypothetical protein